MASDLIKHISDASFEADVLQAGTPVLVDYWAEWCGPCKMLAPVLEEVSEEYAGKVDIYKINVDEEEELASLFSIRSIPTLIFIEKNGTMHRSQGAMGKPQLKEAIESILLR